MVIKLTKYLFLVAIFIFSGCSIPDIQERENIATKLANSNSLEKNSIKTKSFDIRTYYKNSSKKSLRVYIEGDGFAWVNSHTISSNPTPISPVSLQLASIDDSENILYIARPCQYIKSQKCTKSYWTNKRFAKEVVESINQTIDMTKNREQKIELVGFSGGGAIAVLVASMRDDVTKITTVAGNLNHKLLHQIHNVSQIPESLNPIDVVDKVSHIKQLHIVGANDHIITRDIAYSFKQKSKNRGNIKIITAPNCTHTKGWVDYIKNRDIINSK
jgi:hypothetical protein